MKTPPTPLRHSEIPDVCDSCGQRIDRNSPDSMAHHSTGKPHLPFTGKRKRRPAWM